MGHLEERWPISSSRSWIYMIDLEKWWLASFQRGKRPGLKWEISFLAPLTTLKYGLYWLTKRNTYIFYIRRIPIISPSAMKINSEMIAFMGDGKNSCVPLAGQWIERGFFFCAPFFSLRHGEHFVRKRTYACPFLSELETWTQMIFMLLDEMGWRCAVCLSMIFAFLVLQSSRRCVEY